MTSWTSARAGSSRRSATGSRRGCSALGRSRTDATAPADRARRRAPLRRLRRQRAEVDAAARPRLEVGRVDGARPDRLALVGADGAVRTVRLDGISVGSDASEEGGPARVVHYAQPGLAISSDGSQALVVSPGQIAAVDVATLRVSYHPLGAARRALQSVEKGPLDGSTRVAMWARPGQLLVSGVDEHGSID